MKRGFLLLLLLVSCVQSDVPAPVPPVFEAPVVEVPVPVLSPVGFVISEDISPFNFVSSDAVFDSFGIIPVERFDARYQSDIIAVVHVFKFFDSVALDVVLKSEFFEIINLGASSHKNHPIALFLSDDDHRIVIWSSGNFLLYVDTFFPYVAREVLEAYLEMYPSDLETGVCLDSDGDDYYVKGYTNLVQVGSSFVEWSDVCLKDFPAFKNGQFVSSKGLNPVDGLLEGRCSVNSRLPGYVFEYSCHRGCVDGACVLN